MCCGGYDFPLPAGVPIPPEIYDLYPKALKEAWIKFDEWVQQEREKSDDDFIDCTSMPEDVKNAMQLILDTPIPGYENEEITGKDSCYMVVAMKYLINLD